MKRSVFTGFTKPEDLKLKVRSHKNFLSAFPVQKVKFDNLKVFDGIKFIYRQLFETLSNSDV